MFLNDFEGEPLIIASEVRKEQWHLSKEQRKMIAKNNFAPIVKWHFTELLSNKRKKQEQLLIGHKLGSFEQQIAEKSK